MSEKKNGFTIPGESGYENLTLQLAEKWGADVIRDSDGTVLSEEMIHSGYGIYSTICIIRDHNAWINQNTHKRQQTFLCTLPQVAVSDTLTLFIMKDFFAEQFCVNASSEAFSYWEVIDRTSNKKLPACDWNYNTQTEQVTITKVIPFHKYTVSFLAYRIWEEISMYNHTTNNWTKEHLQQLDPRYPEVRKYLRDWLRNWCETHPDTTVVRFTSLFYNFAWIWGSSKRNCNLFSDWASYDFTVSTLALREFEETYGYRMEAEDFINQGKLHVTHMPGNQRKADWMTFINDFVITFGKQLVDIVHSYGKKAYVFYDDSWVGMEPYNGRFHEFGFDGLIKCVFSGYEVRLCASVDVPIHELRFHPYLFPVGLGGAPTFAPGGNPTLDAKKYWIHVRRALLRSKIDRIGLGGYLHLVEAFPDFCDYIEKIADEFRLIRSFFDEGMPYTIKTKVAVLHAWGKLRSWSLSGHFHETDQHDLIHINEALAGLPVEVCFINFEDIKKGALADVNVVINAGFAGSAWSGGEFWKDDEAVSLLTEWVYAGGTFLGVGEPSAVPGYDTYFRMAHVLGVDKDTGARVCHGKWSFETETEDGAALLPEGIELSPLPGIYLTDGEAKVLLSNENTPMVTSYNFGKGKGIYLSSFRLSLPNCRMLYQLIRYGGQEEPLGLYMTDNLFTECAYYPHSHKLVVINNSDKSQITNVETHLGAKKISILPYDTVIMEL
jgi:1,3-beta-galactosyl-N-acetylhexosamine phosphorylase